MKFYLSPSEIRYSQDSISDTFGGYGSYAYRQIGESLDDLLTGKCTVNTIPTISVVKRNGKWFSVDNRRLWVFKKAEELGECDEIPVYESDYLPAHKFTTHNDGLAIKERRNPGGSLWRRWKPKARTTEGYFPQRIRSPFKEIRGRQLNDDDKCHNCGCIIL